MPTKGRHIRIEDELWDKAQTAAGDNGQTLSEVIRSGLEAYVNEYNAGYPRVRRILDDVRGTYPDVGTSTLVRIIRTGIRDLPGETDDDGIRNYIRGWMSQE